MDKKILIPQDRLIVALDYDDAEKALKLVDKLKNDVRFFKVGLELFSSCGPMIVKMIKEKGCNVFLDLKFHDIPNTVARAAVSVMRLGIFMFNVHALGGYDMMRQALLALEDEAARLKAPHPLILGVTILTSLDKKALDKIGISGSTDEAVLRLARMAKDAGLNGVVASPTEAGAIRKELGEDFLVVTPGVRPAWAAAQDQKRIAAPKAAIKSSADFIVVGRPITEAKNPVHAAREIIREMES